MVVCYDKCSEFKEFVKMCISLAHVPLEDLEETIAQLREYKFTTEWIGEGTREEYQQVLMDYIQDQ